MSSVTMGMADELAQQAELYSKKLESIRADLLAVHQKVESLAADYQAVIAIATASAAAAPAPTLSGISSVDSFAAIDPAIGTEIELIADDEGDTLFADSETSDDLTRIDGIDATAAETLDGFGIGSFEALAQIDTDEAAAIGMVLGDPERVDREGWIDQASALLEESAAQPNLIEHDAPVASIANEIENSDDTETSATAAPPVAADPILDDIVIEPDPTTSRLVLAAAALAKAVAAQEERASDAAANAGTADVIEFTAFKAEQAPAASSESPSAEAATVSGGEAKVIDLAAKRFAPFTRRRPRAIAASLVVLLVASVAVGSAAEPILGFDLTTVASCSEAVLQGDASCMGLPTSSF